MTVGAIILAAGSARRMGAQKLLADLGGLPVIAHVLRSIEAAGLPAPIIAVPPDGRLMSRGHLVEVADHALGMGHSLAAAIGAVPDDWQAAIICLGDMPFVLPQTIAALAAAADADNIVRPMFGDKPGNPLAWGRCFFSELSALKGDQGGRAVIARHADRLVALPCGDPGILNDIDTPADLEKARASWGAA